MLYNNRESEILASYHKSFYDSVFNIKTVVRLESSDLAIKKGHQVDLYCWQLHGYSHVFVALSVLKQLTLSPSKMCTEFPVNGNPRL